MTSKVAPAQTEALLGEGSGGWVDGEERRFSNRQLRVQRQKDWNNGKKEVQKELTTLLQEKMRLDHSDCLKHIYSTFTGICFLNDNQSCQSASTRFKHNQHFNFIFDKSKWGSYCYKAKEVSQGRWSYL